MSTRRFHLEQDAIYKEEQCSVTKKWSNTKRVLVNTWTIYEFVGSPSYQTPLVMGVSKADAVRQFKALMEEKALLPVMKGSTS